MVSREGNGGSGFERRREGRNTGAEQCDHSIAGEWFPSSLETRLNYSSHLKRYTRSLLSRAKMYDLVPVHSSIAASQTKVASVLPLVRFQIRSVRSQEPETARWPSPERAAAVTPLE